VWVTHACVLLPLCPCIVVASNLVYGNLLDLHSCDVRLLSNGAHPMLEGAGASVPLATAGAPALALPRAFSNANGWVYDVPAGVHAMSNSSFNDMSWPKVGGRHGSGGVGGKCVCGK
jgi:hypothetical protein